MDSTQATQPVSQLLVMADEEKPKQANHRNTDDSDETSPTIETTFKRPGRRSSTGGKRVKITETDSFEYPTIEANHRVFTKDSPTSSKRDRTKSGITSFAEPFKFKGDKRVRFSDSVDQTTAGVLDTSVHSGKATKGGRVAEDEDEDGEGYEPRSSLKRTHGTCGGVFSTIPFMSDDEEAEMATGGQGGAGSGRGAKNGLTASERASHNGKHGVRGGVFPTMPSLSENSNAEMATLGQNGAESGEAAEAGSAGGVHASHKRKHDVGARLFLTMIGLGDDEAEMANGGRSGEENGAGVEAGNAGGLRASHKGKHRESANAIAAIVKEEIVITEVDQFIAEMAKRAEVLMRLSAALGVKMHDTLTAKDDGGYVENWEDDDKEEDEEEDPTKKWCFCRGPSEGLMVECGNERCSYKWFHVECLDVKKVPQGKWLCPECALKQAKATAAEKARKAKKAKRA